MLPLKSLGEIRFKERKKNVFILYKLPYTNPKPKLITNSKLCAVLDFQKT